MWKSGNIRGIIEVSILLRGDISRIVLLEAAEATMIVRRNVCLPIGTLECTRMASTGDRDTSVDHRNQVGIGNKVQYASRPRPVDAGEQYIAVQGGSISGLRANTLRNLRMYKICGGCTASNPRSQYRDLQLGIPDICWIGMERSIEINLFQGVMINENKFLYASTGERFRYEAAHTTEPYDAHS